MVRIYDPVHLTHPNLREFADMAAWLSVLAETAQELEDLLVDVPSEERQLPDFSTPWPWESDAIAVAHAVVQGHRSDTEAALAELLARWFGHDPDSWFVFRLSVIEPWQERPGIWSEETPEWVRILGTIGHTAHEACDPGARRPPASVPRLVGLLRRLARPR